MHHYQALGFKNHPFAQSNADEEPELDQYFVRPRYFDAVIGDPDRPSSCVVFGPRGGGKTAQRRMLQTVSTGNGFLAVTYDRFDNLLKKKASEVTLQGHLENIISRILVSYLSELSKHKDLAASLSDHQRELIAGFAQTYLKSMTGSELNDILRELKAFPDVAKEFWAKNVNLIEPVIGFITKWLGLPSIKIPRTRKSVPSPDLGSHKSQLEALLELIKPLGFKSIYILVDKIDETPLTNNDASATYDLVRPLLVDLELLSLKGYAFKFFIWDKVEDFYRKGDARPDRISIYNLRWERANLEKLLSERLKVFSDGRVTSLQQIAPDVPNADALACMFANLSPRNLIGLGNSILSVQAEMNSGSNVISAEAFDKGLTEFCEKYVRDTYEASVPLKEVQRVGKEIFTASFAATSVFKISLNAAREKISNWAKTGMVKTIGTVKVATSNKPINLYCIADPCMVRLLYRSEPLAKIVPEMWRECKNCRADNFFTLALFEGRDPTCHECGKNL